MEEEQKIEATVVSPGRVRHVPVGVNGSIEKIPVNTPVSLSPAQAETLENAGYQLVGDGKATGGVEGSAPPVDQGPDDNRTEPHQADEQANDESVANGTGPRDENGDPVIVGGDEPDPKVHSVTGDGITGTTHPLDHDGDGKAGGSTPKTPPALTGKNREQLEAIAADEGVVFGEDVKTNADRINAIEAARAGK